MLLGKLMMIQALRNFLIVLVMLVVAASSTSAAQFSPMVMLVLSQNHELFRKAYPDYNDIDGNGQVDITYNNPTVYPGYFNPDYCYVYNNVAGYFEPSGTVSVPGTDHKCIGADDSKWSGNFLNWATMSHMDVIRHTLYGGKRSTDTPALTVLERALIPSDLHAFVKHAADLDITDGNVSDYTPFTESIISLCNVTDYVSGTSDQSRDLDTAVNPPLLKAAAGRFVFWASSEIEQCQFVEEGGSAATSPTYADSINDGGGTNGEYIARVSVCVTGQDENASYCKDYNGNKKPIGVLQTYGDDTNAQFGLITGSYQQNAEGGVLRKNISSFDEVDLATGIFNSPVNGIVTTLDAIRIAGWDYGSKKYADCDTFGIPVSTFKSSASSTRQCRDWGNPISEMYLEAVRYFAGASSATSSFNTQSDSSWIPNMNTAPWLGAGVISNQNVCDGCSIVLLNASPNNFDGDDLDSASDLPGLNNVADVEQWTEDVGDLEGLTGTNVIVGNADNTSNDNHCTPKTIDAADDGLSGVQGVCPQAPQLEGTYEIAGLAYYAKTTDLRPLLSFTQSVETHAIELQYYKPTYTVPAQDGNKLFMTPVCRMNINGAAAVNDAGWTDCSVADVKVIQQSPFYGNVLISWEDSLWGSDYDKDAVSSIEYCNAVGTALEVQNTCPSYSTNGSRPDWGAAVAGQVQIRTSVPVAFDGNALKFGFIVSGVAANGGASVELLRPGGQTISRLNGMSIGTILWDSIRTYTADSNETSTLRSPLFYAAKYGAFNDLDLDGTPAHTSGDDREWDTANIIGQPVPDGNPDTYYPLKTPVFFPLVIDRVFDQVTSPVDTDNDQFSDAFEDFYGLDPLVDTGDRPTDDVDLDGLTLIDEIIAGSVDSNPDTDGDGLTDSYEATVSGSDPTDVDVVTVGPVVDEGDLNSDGEINVSDVLLLQKRIQNPQP